MCINARRFDVFAIFNSLEPDETEVITDEELLELDNWVLLEPIEKDGQTHALVNLAVEASLSSHNQAEMESRHFFIVQTESCSSHTSSLNVPFGQHPFQEQERVSR